MSSNNKEQDLIKNLMLDVVGDEEFVSKDGIQETISNILKDYNLSTDMSFIEKISSIRFDNETETIDVSSIPSDLKDAAFLPVNTIADIALRQDLDLIISQIPEWYTAIQITRDAICEADLADGRLSRSIMFDKTSLTQDEKENIIAKVEEVEDRLKLHSTIKNHIVFNALHYGESYIYNIPYAKVFEDLYKYRLNGSNNKKDNTSVNMFDTSSILNGYGYHESTVEISLKDAIVNDSAYNGREQKKNKLSSIFTESEIKEINPDYHCYKNNNESEDKVNSVKTRKKNDEAFDDVLDDISQNIRYIGESIALPVIEESAHDLRCVYETKYKEHVDDVNTVNTFFEQVMESTTVDRSTMDPQFKNIKGMYTRILPATKLIPVRIDRNVIGYYYISDLTRPEESGQRRNGGLSGYTLRSPSIGYDTFSPNIMFCEKLATKIINNFNLKFMRDNVALHQQIVAILQSHKFNKAMLRFVFIPAEHVTQFTINEDGMGKGHAMLEPGLVTARLYMFLKLYSVLYQINNSQIRVYNVRMSGIDKDYRQFVQETMRKFTSRRITANDIFNYRSSMGKVNGGSELIMPLGASDTAPISIDSIPAAESPINNELLDSLKHEAINGTPVPSLMVMGGMSEIEFAKETELANTRFNTMVNSYKIDLNISITQLYRRILRWETDIDPEIIRYMKFVFKKPTAKELNITSEMIANFNALFEVLSQTFLKSSELKGEGDEQQSDIVREFKKLLLSEYMPQINTEKFEELANNARDIANRAKLYESNSQENIVNNGLQDEGGMI